MSRSQHDVTKLLWQWRSGDKEALDKLTPLVYDELHRLAHQYISRERSGHTLQTTASSNQVRFSSINISCLTALFPTDSFSWVMRGNR